MNKKDLLETLRDWYAELEDILGKVDDITSTPIDEIKELVYGGSGLGLKGDDRGIFYSLDDVYSAMEDMINELEKEDNEDE